MHCSLFDICGGCTLPLKYEEQLAIKVENWQQKFQTFIKKDVPFLIHPSPKEAFRARAEFNIFHDHDHIFYALINRQKQKMIIPSCPILLEPIQCIFHTLLELLHTYDLSEKLFGINFLSTLSNELLITLLYHKPLEETYEEKIHLLLEALQHDSIKKISIIRRSYKQKKVIGDEYVHEQLNIFDRIFDYIQYEGAFCQPNPYINTQMIEWVCHEASKRGEGDLLELYCGSGNFTLPLSQYYPKILATEVSKTSIKGLKKNLDINQIHSIQMARMHATEIKDALFHVRPFRRLAHVDLNAYSFSTLFVDPPRSGLGEEIVKLAQTFKHIIYVSCHPQTLLSDLLLLTQTHNVQSAAVFDQFPYTHHIESALWLTKK